LALVPNYAVVHVSVGSEKKAPAHVVNNVGLGSALARDLEMIELPMEAARKAAGHIDGVLGQNFLNTAPWLLNLDGGYLVFDPMRTLARPTSEPAVAATDGRGRILVSATVNGNPIRLVLDSGTTNLVLFGREPVAGGRLGRLETHTAGTTAKVGRVSSLRLGNLAYANLPAAHVDAIQEGAAGLLPANLFGSIYCDARRDLLFVTRRAR
jgi:hypothetical protein